MAKESYILAIDQGTTSSRAIVFDSRAKRVADAQKEFTQIFPRPGWVEHDPDEIWATTLWAVSNAVKRAGIDPKSIAGIGITNQRETTVLWDSETSRPAHNAIVWQCRRTAGICEALKKSGHEPLIRQRTGLVLDAYFSGTKVKYLLDKVDKSRKAAKAGKLKFGTIDTWLVWKLTGGQSHATDFSNASRTLLFNIHKMDWDPDILKALNIPAPILPRALPSCGGFGVTKGIKGLPDGIPISGIAGDQQAALFGQTCFETGEAKCTYGTGAFLLMNTGVKARASKNGLLTTIAWGLDGKVYYALEGSCFIAGAAIQWLRDQLQIIKTSPESEQLARSVPDTGGVYFVPAFVGLGAPYWNMYARGTMVGITRGAGRGHIARATLESIAYQVKDVLDAMAADSGAKLQDLRVDGGAAANNFLMQFQSDILGVNVERPKVLETTAMGAAFLAGLGVGLWPDTDAVKKLRSVDRQFKPAMADKQRKSLYAGWKRAVERAMDWEV